MLLLCQALDRSKSWILAHGEYEPTPDEKRTLERNLRILIEGMPLPHILGEWAFYDKNFSITPDVLIPRPETELLVERAMQHLQKMTRPRIADVGTGSGVIAVTLATESTSASIIALDISRPALTVARGNAQRHHQSSIRFVQSNLLEPFQTQFDLICANLPYIPADKLDDLPVSKWEPRLALDGGEDGLEVINVLLQQAQSRLAPGGVFLLEIEASLGENALKAARAAFPTAKHILHQDLSGHDRLIEIQRA